MTTNKTILLYIAGAANGRLYSTGRSPTISKSIMLEFIFMPHTEINRGGGG